MACPIDSADDLTKGEAARVSTSLEASGRSFALVGYEQRIGSEAAVRAVTTG
jgi:hypothetical protein